MGILTVVFAIIHSNPAVKQSTLPSFAICHPEVNDVITKLSLMDKVYKVIEILEVRWLGTKLMQVFKETTTSDES